MIHVFVNGELRELENNATIQDHLSMGIVEMPEYVSVAVNEEFVARKRYGAAILHEGDRVELLYYMGGGMG